MPGASFGFQHANGGTPNASQQFTSADAGRGTRQPSMLRLGSALAQTQPPHTRRRTAPTRATSSSPIQMPSVIPSKSETAPSAFEKLAIVRQTLRHARKRRASSTASTARSRRRTGTRTASSTTDEFAVAWAIYTGKNVTPWPVEASTIDRRSTMNVRHSKWIAPTALALAVTSAWAGQITLVRTAGFPRAVRRGQRRASTPLQGKASATPRRRSSSATARGKCARQPYFRGRCTELLAGELPVDERQPQRARRIGAPDRLRGSVAGDDDPATAGGRNLPQVVVNPPTVNDSAPVINPPPVVVNPP